MGRVMFKKQLYIFFGLIFFIGSTVSAACLPDIKDVAKKALPAVVNISTTQVVETPTSPFFNFGPNDPFQQFFNQFFNNFPVKRKIHALGSGFIISKDGYILTNYHVIKRASVIRVTLLENQDTYTAKVVGTDPKADIALIKIKAKESLPTLPLGNSDAIEIGDWVVAVGNPFGLNGTVTAGIISAKGRVIGEGPFDHFLQTSAAINPGNSGGPLLNLKGEVIGINTAIVEGGQGIGFAIPINMVKAELPYLMKGKKVKRGYLGVMIQNLTAEEARSMGLKGIKRGAIVSQVFKNGPAYKAGLKPGDIIVSVNGKKIKSSSDLPYMIFTMRPGTKVELGIIRNGKPMKVEVTLGVRPASGEMAENGFRVFKTPYGFTVANIVPSLRSKYGIKQKEGVVIIEVEKNSFAYAVGLQVGDLIVRADYKKVRNLDDFKKILAQNKHKNVLFLNIVRGSAQIFVTIQR